MYLESYSIQLLMLQSQDGAHWIVCSCAVIKTKMRTTHGITFIRYAKCQKTGKPNYLRVFGAWKPKGLYRIAKPGKDRGMRTLRTQLLYTGICHIIYQHFLVNSLKCTEHFSVWLRYWIVLTKLNIDMLLHFLLRLNHFTCKVCTVQGCWPNVLDDWLRWRDVYINAQVF